MRLLPFTLDLSWTSPDQSDLDDTYRFSIGYVFETNETFKGPYYDLPYVKTIHIKNETLSGVHVFKARDSIVFTNVVILPSANVTALSGASVELIESDVHEGAVFETGSCNDQSIANWVTQLGTHRRCC